MTDLAAWIKQHASSNSAALREALKANLPAMAAYIHIVDPPPFFGESGLAWRLGQHGVTIEQAQALESALLPFEWWRTEVAGVLSVITTQRQALDLTGATLQPIDRPALVTWLRDAGIPDVAIKPCDDQYQMCDSATLRRLADAVTDRRQYFRQRPDSNDCDNLARWQWGQFAALQPGNLAVGLASITAQIGGAGFAHALLLAACTDGLYWIENDGSVYPYSAAYSNREQVQTNLLVI